MFTVYVLFSESFNKTYVGFTTDLADRLKSHNELATKGWTIHFRPWKIILTEHFEHKKDALNREKWLKSGAGRDFIKSIPR
jgi:putative endonuclease